MNLTLIICYTWIKVLNVNILLLTLILSSAFNVAIYVAVLTTPFERDNLNFSRLYRSHAILTSCTCHANGLREKSS